MYFACKQNLIENSRKFLEHHRHEIEKAAKIDANKKKAIEEEIEDR